MDLSGRTAIVTGGGRGIGRAISVKLAQLGANVVINYAGNSAEADITRELCGGKSIAVMANVADEDDCRALFKISEETFGAPDILVNNAGITRDGLLMRMSDDDFDAVVSVNLKGAFHCTKLASRPMMRARFGRIINITSVVAQMGNAGQVNYVSSKAGLIGLTRASAAELAPRGITVNAIAPGFIETDMTAGLDADVRSMMAARIPLGTFGAPEDVAEAAAFLCSDGARYITGQVLNVNGGMYM